MAIKSEWPSTILLTNPLLNPKYKDRLSLCFHNPCCTRHRVHSATRPTCVQTEFAGFAIASRTSREVFRRQYRSNSKERIRVAWIREASSDIWYVTRLLSSTPRWSKLDAELLLLLGDLTYFSGLGNSVLSINSYKVANDLLDKKGNIYSDRPRLPMDKEM